MSISLLSISQSSLPRTSHNHGQNFTANKPTWRVNSRWGQRYSVIRCCNGKEWMRVKREKNYYELLGVSVDSQSHEIKQAYRNLQKKYHPDIAGQKGHEYTLLLNKAYNVLMREDLRCKYDVSIGEVVSGRRNFSRNISGLDHYSTWNGPLRSQALFVDENACIGCRDCVHHASKTFMMDESLGCARVKVQFGDDDQKIEVSIDSCPVNCIHWVDSDELPVLEFLVKPQPKEGYGVFGGGWERPKNVFMAAKSFNKQLEQQTTNKYQHPNTSYEEETPAQAEARTYASKKIEEEKFSRLWNWTREAFRMNSANAE
ncbi:chaperone protein dnaJ C76, chloroplastic-like [Humulus lupulus]|uniref:chaperone protein dnaJ C76, chloroplastic-like n=1 Tax=Humulus lupulus TaxID=3486 RepID=UPI002B411D7C|nr:chaperone protein dnaJ C76, chloroplastic-like [Humulus lupulus]